MKDLNLFNRLSKRLEDLEKLPKLDETKSIPTVLEEKGINRREFTVKGSFVGKSGEKFEYLCGVKGCKRFRRRRFKLFEVC